MMLEESLRFYYKLSGWNQKPMQFEQIRSIQSIFSLNFRTAQKDVNVDRQHNNV